MEEQGAFAFGDAVELIADLEEFAGFTDLADEHAAVDVVVEDVAELSAPLHEPAPAAAVGRVLEARRTADELAVLLRPNIDHPLGDDTDRGSAVALVPGRDQLSGKS